MSDDEHGTQEADIAKWMRDNAQPGPLGRRMIEAANEIERLRDIKVLDNDQYDFEDKLLDFKNERDWAQDALLDILDFKPEEGAGDPYQQIVNFAMDRAKSAFS